MVHIVGADLGRNLLIGGVLAIAVLLWVLGASRGMWILALSGCATYRPHPLPTSPDLTRTPQLTVPAQQFWLLGLPLRPVSTQGLDEITVVTLAVFNNPDLKAARLQAGVASAQLLEAGLLPDPRFDASFATSASITVAFSV